MAGHTIPDEAIKDAMVAALRTALNNRYPVFKRWPTPNIAMPYINIESVAGSLFSDKSNWGDNQIYTVHVWSQYTHDDLLNSIMSDCSEALTDGTVTASGFNTLGIMKDSHNVMPDPDRKAWHGILSMRVITTGNARP